MEVMAGIGNWGGSFVGYVIPFLLVLSVVVFVHELGHFWVARRFGVRIETFSIGFGREIFGWNDRHGTRWKVAWLPLGGYVKFYGDENAASAPDAERLRAMTPEERQHNFHAKPVYQRMAIVAAGPCANFLLSVVIFALLFMIAWPASTRSCPTARPPRPASRPAMSSSPSMARRSRASPRCSASSA